MNQLQKNITSVLAAVSDLTPEERLKVLAMSIGRVMVEELNTLDMALTIAGPVPATIEIDIYPATEG